MTFAAVVLPLSGAEELASLRMAQPEQMALFLVLTERKV